MKTTLTLLLVLMLSFPCLTDTQTEKLHFKNLGYSIAPLEGTPDVLMYQTLMMFLPVTDAFAPNVNIQIQPYKDSIKEYVDLTNEQFEAAELQIVKSSLTNENTAVFEYTGFMQGYELHWYAKAISRDNNIYLVTATSLISQWSNVSAQLIECVDSFELD